MEYLQIKNWEQHQHYKDRCPPWIKLHVNILNSIKFAMLSRASRCLLMLLWVLGSEADGIIPNDINVLRFRLRDNTIKQEEINLLINKGFLSSNKKLQADDSTVQADACLETETETDIYSANFLNFWSEYPNKKAKQSAYKKWKTLQKQKKLPSLTIIISSIEKQKRWRENANGEFRPEWKHPTTWLNAGCWEDEVQSKPQIRYEQVG